MQVFQRMKQKSKDIMYKVPVFQINVTPYCCRECQMAKIINLCFYQIMTKYKKPCANLSSLIKDLNKTLLLCSGQTHERHESCLH